MGILDDLKNKGELEARAARLKAEKSSQKPAREPQKAPEKLAPTPEPEKPQKVPQEAPEKPKEPVELEATTTSTTSISTESSSPETKPVAPSSMDPQMMVRLDAMEHQVERDSQLRADAPADGKRRAEIVKSLRQRMVETAPENPLDVNEVKQRMAEITKTALYRSLNRPS